MRVLIRADGDANLGSGHVMRMLALAEHISNAGGKACFASLVLDNQLEQRVLSKGIDVVRGSGRPGLEEDFRWVLDQAAGCGADWVVADGYCFAETFQEGIKAVGLRLLVMDDYGHSRRYSADIVLNQSAAANALLYANRGDHTRLLLGPRYALLRSEFTACHPPFAAVPERAHRVLVTMGGADPVEATPRVLDALAEIEDPAMQVRVVLGASNPKAALIAESARDPRCEFLTAVDDMVESMRWADLAIAAGGTTASELCSVGVPTMLLILAENQEGVARGLSQEGACENLGWFNRIDSRTLAARIDALCGAPKRRSEMARRGRSLVDGRGCARVCDAMRAIGDGGRR